LKYGSKASVTKKAKSKKEKISNEPTDDAAKTLKFNWYEEESKRQEEYFRYLKADFGDKVAETVKLVTKGYDKNGAPINYKEDANMDAYLKNISDAESASAAKIKIADRMNNNSTLTVCTDEKKQSKTLETHTYYLPFARKVSDKDRKNVSFYEKAAKFFEQEIV
jgi:(p)ppGpp synthase/HD superfamily hydrolase